MTDRAGMWLAFNLLVVVMLTIDLGLARKKHEVSFREALAWSGVWIGLALLFNAGIYHYLGTEKALEFFAGYLIEKSLSVDNLFVFIMIFSYFQVKPLHQPKILKWGILGALVMRAVFIFAGIELLEMFHWVIYLFGALLILTGIRMCFSGSGQLDPEKNLLVRLVRRFIPITTRSPGGRFVISRCGMRAGTPMLLALVMIESSDVIFAIDSIPAVFAVTRDPFIVYTSNVFAIMGLRALYFLLSNVIGLFRHLKYGISIILIFVGCKMLLAETAYAIPTAVSLAVVFGVLALSVATSVVFARSATPHQRR